MSAYSVKIEAIRKETIPEDFEKIHLIFEIGINDPISQVEKVVQLGLEKYCSVYASLNNEIKISYEIAKIEKQNKKENLIIIGENTVILFFAILRLPDIPK